MSCKFEYNGVWYEEAQLKELFNAQQLDNMVGGKQDKTYTLSKEEEKTLISNNNRIKYQLTLPFLEANRAIETISTKDRMAILSTSENLVGNNPLQYLRITQGGKVYLDVQLLARAVRKEFGDQIIPAKALKEAKTYMEQFENMDVSYKVASWKKTLNTNLKVADDKIKEIYTTIATGDVEKMFKKLVSTSIHQKDGFAQTNQSFDLKGKDGNYYNFHYTNGKLTGINKRYTKETNIIGDPLKAGEQGYRSIGYDRITQEDNEDNWIAANIALSEFKKNKDRLKNALDKKLTQPILRGKFMIEQKLKEDLETQIREEELERAMEQFSPEDILSYGVEELVKRNLISNSVINEEGYLSTEFGISSDDLLEQSNNEAFQQIKNKKELLNKIISNKEKYNIELDKWETEDSDMMAPMPGWWVNAVSVFTNGKLFDEITGFFAGMVKGVIMLTAQQEYDALHDNQKAPGFQKLLDTKNISTLLPEAIKHTSKENLSGKAALYNQQEGTEGSKASVATVAKVKVFLKRIGVSIGSLDKRYGGNNAVADMLRDLIQIAEGKEDVALTEEAMHFVVEIIQQSNPVLFNKLMNKIGSYQMYKSVSEEYKDNPDYQKNGLPDVIKLKKEAIGKVLAEYFILHNEGSLEKPELLAQSQGWWETIMNWLKGLVEKYDNPFKDALIEMGTIEDTSALEVPYKELAKKIVDKNVAGIYGVQVKALYKQGKYRGVIAELSDQLEDPLSREAALSLLKGDEQLAQDILEAHNIFAQQAGSQSVVYDKITNTAQLITKSPSPTKKDENGKPVDSYFYKGVEIAKRVTDKAKLYYENLWGNTAITQTDYQKAVNTLIAEKGTDGHEDLQHAFGVMVKNGIFDPTATIDSTYVPKTNRTIYKVLFANLKERLSTFKNAKFLSEVSVVDEKKDIAGTIDLLVVKEDGSIQILDWKFINLNTEKFQDVPWFKQRAWNIQIGEYKRILAERYGIPSHMIKGEAIPIKANYVFPFSQNGKKTLPYLEAIEIGNVNVKTEDRDYLLPVTLTGQDTGNKEINKLIAKLNALHKNLEDLEVKGIEEKAKKAEQLQFIDKAMRHLAVRNTIGPLITQADIYTKDVQRVVDIYNSSYKNKDFTTDPPSNAELSEYGIQLDNALAQIQIYTDLDVALESLSGTDVSEEAQKAHAELTAVVSKARFLERALENTINEFGEKIGNSVGFSDLTDPETVVTTISKLFSETSKLPTQVLKVMYEKLREAKNLTAVSTNEENRRLEEIKKEYEELAKSKGLGLKDMFSLVMDYTKNQLISQFDAKFYKEAKAATKNKEEGVKWIKANVDVIKYKADLAEALKKNIELINSRPWKDEEKKVAIDRKKRQYDTTAVDSPGWFLHYKILRDSPLEKWTTAEWKTLWEKGNEPAQKLYNWIRDINKKAEEAGYLPENKAARTFLPYVVKSFAERIIFGGDITLGEDFIRAMTVDADTVGYGSIDPLTGKPVLKIPKYFTSGTDKELSTNLIKNLALYNQALNNYKYISEVEGIAKVLGRLERNKQSIITNDYGRAIFDKETGTHELSEDNSKNAALFDKQMATLIYGQKYVNSEKFDTLMFKVGKSFENINKTLGVKLLPEGLSERQFSLNKSIDTLNTYFQQKTLGLNPLPALSNLVGGSLQITINSGKYMNKKELLASQANLASAAVRGEDGKKLLAAMEYFMPFTGNDNFRKMLHDMSVTKWTENSIQDFLMILMRSGDKYVQATLFTTLWENAIVVDGKVYNAREYVRKETSYKNRYSSPDVQEEEKKFNDLVAEVKEKYSLSKTATLDAKGKLVLPIERNSREAFALTNLSQALAKRATGTLTPADVRGITQNVWGASFMVFKNWIPALVDARFGKLKYASDVEAYEWGRARTVGRIMMKDGILGIKSMVDLITFNAFSISKAGKIVKGTEDGLKSLQELYEYKKQQYFEQTGKQLEISQDEFFDMVRQNIRNQAKDTLITLSFLTMFFAAKALPPDKDEDPDVINRHKFLVRALDKLSDEVSFYYLPTSFQSMLNGSVMPSVAVFSDGIRIITHGFTELYGIGWDQEIEDKNYFIKYLAKSFPVTSQMSSYLPLYAPDLAKELGIQLGSQARR